jgi:phosphotransferase system  glucose/maltose/N-acetylglucosamine-specific IIC component
MAEMTDTCRRDKQDCDVVRTAVAKHASVGDVSMTDWLRRLSFTTKMAVIAIAAMVPLLFLTVLALTEKQKSIRVVAHELAGLHHYQNLEAMLLPVGMHEIWSAASVAGEGAAEKAAGRHRRRVAPIAAAGRQ